MLNPIEIAPKHLPPMQAALMKHRSRLDEHRIAAIYRDAKRLLREKGQLPEDVAIMRSKIETGSLVIASCTDVETGLFVQLSGSEGAPDNDLVLVFGQKYCQEARDTVRQNTAIKIW